MLILCTQAARKHRVACKVRCETCSAAHAFLKITIPSLSDCGGPTVDLQCMGGRDRPPCSRSDRGRHLVDPRSACDRSQIKARSANDRLFSDMSVQGRCRVYSDDWRSILARSRSIAGRSRAAVRFRADAEASRLPVDPTGLDPAVGPVPISVDPGQSRIGRRLRVDHGSTWFIPNVPGRSGATPGRRRHPVRPRSVRIEPKPIPDRPSSESRSRIDLGSNRPRVMASGRSRIELKCIPDRPPAAGRVRVDGGSSPSQDTHG